MRVLITAVGSGGDIHPYIAIGATLRARGHSVEMLVNPRYEARVRDVGLAFRPLGTREQYEEIEADPRIAAPRTSTRFILEQLMDTPVVPIVEGCEASVREFKPDLILRHHVSIGSRWVAERHGIRCVNGALSPLMCLSSREPVGTDMPFIEELPGWLMPVLRKVARVSLRARFDRPINAKRREMGFTPDRSLFLTELQSGGPLLGLWSPAFRGPMPDDPSNLRIAGFCVYDRAPGEETRSDEIVRFLDRCPRPPVVFSLGTIMSHHGRAFYHAAAEVCRMLDIPGILLCPKREMLPESLPPQAAAFAYAPFSSLLPRASLFVHHGGIGTTAQGLMAGVPQVVVPHIADQFDNGARVRRLGLGGMVRAWKATPRRLAEVVREALEGGHGPRCKTIAAAIARENGPEAAVRLIEG